MKNLKYFLIVILSLGITFCTDGQIEGLFMATIR